MMIKSHGLVLLNLYDDFDSILLQKLFDPSKTYTFKVVAFRHLFKQIYFKGFKVAKRFGKRLPADLIAKNIKLTSS